MATIRRGAKFALAMFAGLAVAASAAAQKKEFRYPLGPGASITIVNDYGPVTMKPSTGGQAVVTATPASSKVEVYSNRTGNRVEVRTHFLQAASPDEGRVEYEVQVPPDANVTVRTGNGAIHVEKLRGNLYLSSDTSSIDVREIANGLVHARTVSGPVLLTNVSNANVDVTSVSGEVTLNNVTGPNVSVNTTKSTISYRGDFAGGGEYSLTNHSGDINVALPASASVDVTARSVSGSVQNDFPFQPKAHAAFPLTQRSFAGTSNAGASMVRLRSFSGTIRVKKQ